MTSSRNFKYTEFTELYLYEGKGAQGKISEQNEKEELYGFWKSKNTGRDYVLL